MARGIDPDGDRTIGVVTKVTDKQTVKKTALFLSLKRLVVSCLYALVDIIG